MILDIMIFLLLLTVLICLLKMIYPLMGSYIETEHKFDSAEKYINSFGDNLTIEQIKTIKNTCVYQACLVGDNSKKLFKVIIEQLLPKKKKSVFKATLCSNAIDSNRLSFSPGALEEAIKKYKKLPLYLDHNRIGWAGNFVVKDDKLIADIEFDKDKER